MQVSHLCSFHAAVRTWLREVSIVGIVVVDACRRWCTAYCTVVVLKTQVGN